MTCLDRAITQIDDIFSELDKKLTEAAEKAKSTSIAPPPAAALPVGPEAANLGAGKKPKKDKQAGKEKNPKAPVAAVAPVDPIQKANLRVARIVSAEAVENSDKLWKCQVDVGRDAPVQVVAGLQQHIPLEKMSGLAVIAILNLKPAKLAGQLSEAMILAADHSLPDGAILVRTLVPSADAKPGDQVFVEGGAPHDSTPKTLKREHWQSVVDKLKTCSSRPTYDGVPLCSAAGAITVADMPDGAGIH